MNRKISRNEKYKYSNEEKLAFGENENTSALINITQEYDSNIFELLQNLWINNLRFIILKCSRFCLFVPFVVFFTFTVYTNVLNAVVFMVRKGKKKAIFKANLSRLLKFSVFSNFYSTFKKLSLANKY